MSKFVLKNALLVCSFCIMGAATQTAAVAQRPIERIFNLSMATKGDAWAQSQASSRPWHGQYYYMPYGQPTAIVVPPTVSMQQNYSWGVSQNTMTPVYHQYGYAAEPSSGGGFYGTPRWPSNTRQFGVYPVRAPW